MDRIRGSGRSAGHILIGVVLSLVVAVALCAGPAASAVSGTRAPAVETPADGPDEGRKVLGDTSAVYLEEDDSPAFGAGSTLPGDLHQ